MCLACEQLQAEWLQMLCRICLHTKKETGECGMLMGQSRAEALTIYRSLLLLEGWGQPGSDACLMISVKVVVQGDLPEPSRLRWHSWKNQAKTWSARESWRSVMSCLPVYFQCLPCKLKHRVRFNKYLWQNMNQWMKMTGASSKNTKSDERQDGNQGVVLSLRGQQRSKDETHSAWFCVD